MATPTSYQRVNTTTDYDASAGLVYLRFDGTDDFLVTPSIDFTGTDKMTVFAGVRKLSDATSAVPVELSTDAAINNGAFGIAAPGSLGANSYRYQVRGTVVNNEAQTGATYPSPTTNVITGISSISTDVATLRVNGVQAATSAADQGTGNYGNYPLYIGRRGGTTLPFNGQIYSLIVRGAETSGSMLTQTERYVNDKTSAPFFGSVLDSSIGNKPLDIKGTITKRRVDYVDSNNAGTSDLVAYSGFSSTSYLEQGYNSALDVGTGEWSWNCWAKVPVSLPVGSFPVTGSSLAAVSTMSAGTGVSIVGEVASCPGAGAATYGTLLSRTIGATFNKSFVITFTIANNTQGNVYLDAGGFSSSTATIAGNGTYTRIISATNASSNSVFYMRSGNGIFVGDISNVSVHLAGDAKVADRNYASGSKISIGVLPLGYLTATASDGTTVRTVTTTTAYNTNTWINPVLTYTTDGKLAIKVNGVEVQSATGVALASLSNSNAILTVGNSLAHDAPFPGSIALLRASTTVPSADQLANSYADELQNFLPGAKSLLAGTSPAVTSLTYDKITDTVHASTSYGRTAFRNLLQVESEATTVGTVTSLAALNGTVVTGGSTSSYLYVPARALRDELNRASEQRATFGNVPVNQSFTATSGQTAFAATKGYSVLFVYINGLLKQETTDYTLAYDGYQWTVNTTSGVPINQRVNLMLIRS